MLGPDHDLQPGTCLGPYTVDSTLSTREDRAVHLVFHEKERTWHALKVFKHAGGRLRERLAREALLRAALYHPNIVPGRELLDARGAPALLMDFVEGHSLAERIAQGPLPAGDAIALFEGITAGAAHAHAHGLTHRDLRPDNVLLQPDGPDQVVPRVLGWGLAKVNHDGSRLTTVHRALGTPGYAAPEQLDDAASVGPTADVFSLGAVLYAMLCGEPPFRGSELGAALAARKREYTPLDQRRPDVPVALSRWLDTLLDPDPTKRPSDGAAVLASLPFDVRTVEAPDAWEPLPALTWLGWITLPPLAAAAAGFLVTSLAG